MNNKSQKKTSKKQSSDTSKLGKYKSNNENFNRQVDNMATRKLKAQRHVNKIVWMGFGMMGIIGWSVVVPTLLGTIVGIWLDKHYPGEHSRTLILLVVGLCLGCVNAWYWIDKEDKEIHRGD